MKPGYACVSTSAEDLGSQRAELDAAGCGTVFGEKVSGARRKRPELDRLLSQFRKRDTVVVTRLDRLAHPTSELLRVAEIVREKDVGLQPPAEPWADTAPPSGRMVLTVFAGIVEFERELVRG